MKREIKLWGTRGSCAVSGPEYLEFGGNSCCCSIEYDDTFLIIDAGTGIRPLGETLLKQKKINLFLSHMHWDHIIGLPFFDPIYEKDVEITIWAPLGEGRTCEELLKELLSPEFFPIHLSQVKAKLSFQVIEEKKPIQLGPLEIDFHQTRHPSTTFGFKIKTPEETIGYITDNELDLGSQKGFIEFFQKSDLFIHEAQYFPQEYEEKIGWGHSCMSKSIELIEKIGPKQWFVTHHDPKHTDEDLKKLLSIAQSKKLPCPVHFLKDRDVLPLK